MNKRAIYKKVIKRKNKYNHDYCFLRLTTDKNQDDLIEKIYWTKYRWKFMENWYIINEKPHYIMNTIKEVCKLLKWTKFKIK